MPAIGKARKLALDVERPYYVEEHADVFGQYFVTKSFIQFLLSMIHKHIILSSFYLCVAL